LISAPAMVAAVDPGPPALADELALRVEAVRDPWRGPGALLLRVAATAPVGGELGATVVVDPEVVERWNLAGSTPATAAATREQPLPLVGGGSTSRSVALLELALRDGVAGRQVVASLRVRWRPVTGAGKWLEATRTLRGEEIAPSWNAAPATLRVAAVAGRFAEVLATASTGDGAAQDALADLARRADALPPTKGGADDLARTIARAREIHAREIPARSQQHD